MCEGINVYRVTIHESKVRGMYIRQVIIYHLYTIRIYMYLKQRCHLTSIQYGLHAFSVSSIANVTLGIYCKALNNIRQCLGKDVLH